MIVDNKDLDYTTIENQKALDEFNDKLSNCDGCQEQWIKTSSLNSWFVGFKAYAQQTTGDSTSACSGAWDSDNEVIASAKFYECLDVYLNSMQGNSYKNNILMNDDNTAIIGFK